jgi:flagellar hook-associated protein 3 FlgL
MRIADTTRMDRLVKSTTEIERKIATVSQRASSGIALDVPSTDPVNAAAYLRSRGNVERLKGYGDAITTAKGELELSEATLAQAQDLIARGREIALQAANSTYSAKDRAQFATEIGQLRDQLISAANQKGPNGYLFGGSDTSTPPFDTTGTFVGNGDARKLEVGPCVTVTMNGSGAKAFTSAGGQDVFSIFTQLQAVVRSALARSATMLAGLGVKFRLVSDGATSTLQKQVGAFTARKFGLGAEVACHLIFLYATTASKMREPGDASMAWRWAWFEIRYGDAFVGGSRCAGRVSHRQSR